MAVDNAREVSLNGAMRRFGARLAWIALGMVLAAAPAFARPIFVFMDVADPPNAPGEFGYRVSAQRSSNDVVFTLDLDAGASAAFTGASVFFFTPVEKQPRIPVTVSVTAPGRKRLVFAVPAPHLGHCVLQIDSHPLRPRDRFDNFSAYRLRLDDVPQLPPRRAGQ